MKIILRTLIITLTISLIFVGCNINSEIPEVPYYIGDDDPAEEEEYVPRNFKLISLGDSYTIGQSVCEDCRFPAQLRDSLQTYFSEADSLSLEVIAQTGWTTSNLKSAITTAQPPTDFDLATLLIGVNNQYQGKPFSLYERLSQLLKKPIYTLKVPFLLEALVMIKDKCICMSKH